MLIRKTSNMTSIMAQAGIAPSDITPEQVYLNRRSFTGLAGSLALGAALPALTTTPAAAATTPLKFVPGPFATDEAKTPVEDVTSYNNFYEFGTGKSDPKANAGTLTTAPWTVKVDGLVDKPGTYALEDILKDVTLEERIYRMRCVEGWSMVIPWVGFPLAELIKRVEPQGSAKYLVFETLVRPSEMPGQRALLPSIDWPYVEGLRMDEAMNPLTIMAVGLYGQTLPNQNGTPLRLVVPWKYGFKGIKSIVRIGFVERQPVSSWVKLQPREYGFYANVNPQVDHPRWSQASERRIGEGGIFVKRRPTLMFNGYAEQVAGLYSNMDLRLNY